MNARENLLKVLHHEDPAWIPVLPLIDSYNMPAYIPRNLLTRKIKTTGICRWLGGDILNRCGVIREIPSSRIHSTNESVGDITTTIIETPVGRLTSRRQKTKIKWTGRHEERSEDNVEMVGDIETSYRIDYLVRQESDYAVVRSLFENTKYDLDTKRLGEEIDAIGDDGLAMPCGPSTPLMQLVHNLVGIEKLAGDLLDYSETIDATLAVMEERYLEWYRVAAQSEAQVIMCSDDATTNLISPRLFEQYMLPAFRKAAEICHARKKPLVVHTCGLIRDLLHLFAKTGIDAVECVCPPSTGNTPPGLARKVWGRKIVVIARLDPPVLVHGSPDEVRRAVESMLMEVAPGDNFALTLPAGRAPVENLRAAVETIRRLGSFPIRRTVP